MSTTTNVSTFREQLEQVIRTVVAPAAIDVDRSGAFPTHSIQALGEAGLLGLLSSGDVGGAGLGLREAAEVVEQLSGACGSTAMVLLMHYAAVQVLEAHAPREIRAAVAAGRHLSTLAFSESGSRAHFWAPLGTATRLDDRVSLTAQKSWVTSAAQADSYVWSSRPLAGDAPMTLWLMPARTPGLERGASFDGLGLRGNGSIPVAAVGVELPLSAMLGEDGAGLDYALSLVLPTFQVLSTAFCLGLVSAVTAETAGYLTATRLAHLDATLAEQQSVRLDFARMQLETDRLRAFLLDTLTALETQRADAMLRVLESKAAGAESALAVTDLAMKLCGGAAFRKELGIERRFRDSRAARVMAPTTDALLDFVGRATLNLPLFDGAIAR